MGSCARICRLGAILGRGARTSTIRVLGLGLGLGLDTRLMQSRCITMIALMQVRGSQVSMGAEGGSNALSTETDAVSRTSATLFTRNARGSPGGSWVILGLRVSCKRAANGVHTRLARAGFACTLHILGTCA